MQARVHLLISITSIPLLTSFASAFTLLTSSQFKLVARYTKHQSQGESTTTTTGPIDSDIIVDNDINNEIPPSPLLIPKELLFENLEYRDPALSPDGKFIAYIAPRHSDDSCCYIYILRVGDTVASAQIVSPDNRIKSFFWAPDSRTILYYVNDSLPGSEIYHLWRTNAVDVLEQKSLDVAHTQDLTPGDRVKAQNAILSNLAEYRDQILIATNERDATLFDMYRINIYTGERILDTINPGDVISWGVEQTTFKVRQALARNQEDSSTMIRICDDSGNWRELLHFPFGEIGRFIGFCSDRESCWVTSSCGRDTTALMRINIQTGERLKICESNDKLLLYNDKCDIGEIYFDNKKNISYISYYYAQRELHFLNKEIERHFEILAQLGPVSRRDEIHVISKSDDELLWLISYEPSDGPNYYVLYRVKEEAIDPLFCSQPELLQYMKYFSKMEGLTITARDNLKLVAYLTKPRQPSQDLKLPLVVLVHGGPWARDYYGFNILVQWLANRGYAVLQVNFRGSSGFGKDFLHKGDKQWGIGGMQNDLTDSVQYCIDKGIADKDNICIFGSSYGGYACLAGLCFTPDLYKCGVNIAGPSNLKTLLDSIPSYWRPLRNTMLLRIGNVDDDDSFNQKISPLFHIENIISPLLIGQGGNDPRVKQSETDRIAFAMKKMNIDVEYHLYPDEGHNILKPNNRLHFYGCVEAFLAKHLGGRCESIKTIKCSVLNPLDD